jgi:hypothetical protein
VQLSQYLQRRSLPMRGPAARVPVSLCNVRNNIVVNPDGLIARAGAYETARPNIAGMNAYLGYQSLCSVLAPDILATPSRSPMGGDSRQDRK